MRSSLFAPSFPESAFQPLLPYLTPKNKRTVSSVAYVLFAPEAELDSIPLPTETTRDN